ncbi:hypothetical protein DPMN_014839 [Dreissena polymorpha]|uniref:VWFA domain-containing protein n=1 Tax=Dreissena polymorpha TaxID=45954 RepID=A0A9D4NA07_DREPO|nr:hypothetical protein DPMN_014839 [Dreissena polymorpha]
MEMEKHFIGLILFATCVIVNSQTRTLSDVEYFCGNKPADVVFMLDSSNSIWGPDFQRQLTFVNDVIGMFEIAENVTRVAVSTFSSQVNRIFFLDTYVDKWSIQRQVSSIRQEHGYITNTGMAILHMRHRMFSDQHGARPGVAKIGIVLTDGQSHNLAKTVYEAFRAKRDRITMFAIGIGDNINERELEGIASKPKEEYMFKVDGSRPWTPSRARWP